MTKTNENVISYFCISFLNKNGDIYFREYTYNIILLFYTIVQHFSSRFFGVEDLKGLPLTWDPFRHLILPHPVHEDEAEGIDEGTDTDIVVVEIRGAVVTDDVRW